ncbi:TetR/AcrR family transcriptional regulator [Gammaproteobacteria bacterium]|nr:TetR/AcrR family transcriptional regulator [Gammaproteobacteria bacterium]
MVRIKKTEKTKAKLLKAVRFIITKGDKASVTSITKKANLAYGTFYRYFKDLDEIYLEAIEASLADLSVKLTKDLASVHPAPLRVYVTWYLVIDFFKDKHTATWLLEHPGKINKGFLDAQPMSEAWIQEAIKDSKLPSFTKKNADHYLKVRAYIFWMYPECLSQVLKGKKTVNVFTELMNACNVFNFSHSIHQSYIRKSIQYFEKNLID